MRVSSYLIGTETVAEEFFLLLHGYTGAVDKVSRELGQALLDARGLSVDHLFRTIPNVDVECLAKRGYVTELSEEAERQLLVKIALELHSGDLADTPASLMFVPAYTCNLRCPYCFQPHDYHQGRGKYSTILSRDLVDAGFRIGQEFHAPGALARHVGLLPEAAEKKLYGTFPHGSKVGLFGGEPLSASTEAIVRYIAGKAVDHGMVVTAITNGVELEHFADVLGPDSLAELQITLDGTARSHDRRRVGPGFKETFAHICDNIDLALSYGVQISLRMNVDSVNAAELESLNDFCVERGWASHRLFRAHAAAVSPEGNYRKGIMTRAELVEQTLDITSRKTSVFRSYENTARETLNNCLFSDGYAFKGVANCSAESGLLMFDPLGDVYSCWEEIGDTSLRVATYSSDGINFEGERMARWLSRFPGAIEECSRCPYALIHLSGCGKHAADHAGTIFANACESFQDYFPRTLSNAYEEFEAHVQHRPVRIEARAISRLSPNDTVLVQITNNSTN